MGAYHARVAMQFDPTAATIATSTLSLPVAADSMVMLTRVLFIPYAPIGTVGYTDMMAAVVAKSPTSLGITALGPSVLAAHTAIHFAGSILDSGSGQSNVKNSSMAMVELPRITPEGLTLVVGGNVYFCMGSVAVKATAPVAYGFFEVEYDIVTATAIRSLSVAAQY